MKICSVWCLFIFTFFGCSSESSLSTIENGSEKKLYSEIVQWENVYSGNSTLMLTQMQVTKDGGCVTFAPKVETQRGSGIISPDFSGVDIKKYSSAGVLEWVKTCNDSLYANDGFTVVQTSDGGCLIVGEKVGVDGTTDGRIGKL